jgi:putative RecB family exonuclease
MKLYITGSRLETYVSCPYKYYLANVRKLQKPFGASSPLLAFDQSLHKTLTSFYRFHNQEEPFDYAKLLKCLDYNWHSSNYETAEISAEYKETAANFLKNYFEKYCNGRDRHYDTDLFFKTEIAGIEYGGKIDRIDKNDDGTIEIIDYKTGKMPANGVSELEESLSVQLLFLACDSMYPNSVKRLTYIYLKDNETLYVNRNDYKLQEALKEFKAISNYVMQGKFEAKPSNACSWCDYRNNCPDGQKNTLSPAKLKSFIDCPKKYSFKYIERQATNNESPKTALLFYNYMNSMMTNLYKGGKQYSTKKLIEHAQKALNNHKELDEETTNSLLNDCKKSFEYINELINKDGFPNTKSYKEELKYSLESINLSANIDRIDVLESGKLQLVSYKTTKQAPNVNSLKNDISNALIWYTANLLYPKEIDSIRFVFLLAGQTIDFVPSDIAIARLKDYISVFLKEKAFAGVRGSLCSWCDYYGPCPEWKIKPIELANETPEQFKKRIRLSYSKMNQYLNCPYAYKKLYIDKIAPQPKPFFDFGKAIHETFEIVYSPDNEIIKKPTLEELIAIYDKVRLGYRDSFSTDELENKFRDDGIRQLTLYYNRYIKDNEFKPAEAVERYFEIPCGKNAVMTGSIDRIDKLADGTFAILDYKTEQNMRTQEEVDRDKQLSIYYWAATESMGYDISKLALLMLNHDTTIETKRLKNDIPDVLETIDRTAYEMIHEEIFPPKINKYCKVCDHLNYCPIKEEVMKEITTDSVEEFLDESPDLDV